MAAINSIVENRGEFIGAFRENVIRVIGNYSTRNVHTEYDEQIATLQKKILTLVEENAQAGSGAGEDNGQYRKVAGQIRMLQQKKLDAVREQKLASDYGQRVDKVEFCLKRVPGKIVEFDNGLVQRLLQSIKVVGGDMLEIQFKSGIVMKQRASCYD